MIQPSSEARLVDVARRAGCSPATVSRVLNRNPSVGAEVRDRVMRAAIDVGYVPSPTARGSRLADGATTRALVGAVIPTMGHAIYATMIDELQVRLSEKDTSLIISTSRYDLDLELEQIRLLLDRGVGSIVLVGAWHHPQALALLERRSVPCVLTYTAEAIEPMAVIGFDNEKAGRTGARFLLDLGHRRLAMISGLTQDNDRAARRVRGFLNELTASGLDVASVPVIETPYQVEAGRAAMSALMSAASPPTAVFCGSDILAAGALQHCAERGIAVPSAVSVLGFDNLELAAITNPALTTLEVPARAMGRFAGDYILASPAQRRHLRHTALTVSLVVRASTGPYIPAT